MTMMVLAPATRTLGEIAADIRSHWAATDDDRFAIGRCLIEARAQFPSDPLFGTWFREQDFPFTTQWGRTLRLAAENEPTVRNLLVTQVASGKKPNIQKALTEVLREAREEVPTTKLRVASKRVRRSPRWRREFTLWCHHVLPEDRVYLVPISRDLHRALGLVGLSCHAKES